MTLVPRLCLGTHTVKLCFTYRRAALPWAPKQSLGTSAIIMLADPMIHWLKVSVKLGEVHSDPLNYDPLNYFILLL